MSNIDVTVCRGRAVTNVGYCGRTCGPTPLLECIDAIKYVYTIDTTSRVLKCPLNIKSITNLRFFYLGR